MSIDENTLRAPGADRVPRTFWVGLVAVVVFVLLVAGLSNLLKALFPSDSPEVQFAVSHLVGLPIAIVAGLVFLRWSGWGRDVWSPALPDETTRPRRRWLLAFPVLMLVTPVTGLMSAPWSERSIWFVLLLALGCLLIGVAEELFYRGILRVSIRAHHGEFLTVVVTALLFGVSHSFSSFVNGIPLAIILFQVSVTALEGVFLYAAFLATRTLWVPIAIHAFTDFALYVRSGNTDAATGHGGDEIGPAAVGAQIVLGVLVVIFLIGALRNDARARRERKAAAAATA